MDPMKKRWLWLLLIAALLPGCITFPTMPGADPLHRPVCQLVATWQHKVVFAPDPVHGGAESPGLLGRLYLFSQELDYPVIGDGSLVVDLYVMEQPDPKQPAQPRLLEKWQFDAATLKRLLRKDVIGWGYTVFLPWGSFRPDISQVQLKVRYETAQKMPFFTESGALTIGGGPGGTLPMPRKYAAPVPEKVVIRQ